MRPRLESSNVSLVRVIPNKFRKCIQPCEFVSLLYQQKGALECVERAPAQQELWRTRLQLKHGDINLGTMSEFQADCNNDKCCTGNQSLLCFRNCSLMLGYICGVFVHLSSFAANYCLKFQYQINADKMNLNYDDNQVLLTNLMWSLVTSFIAFSVLGVLRNVIGLKETRLEQLDALFSTGALGGLCSSWFLSDLFLGLRMHLRTSCFLSIVAALCFKGLTGMWADCRAQQQDKLIINDEVVEPLLKDTSEQAFQSESDHARFRWLGLRCGALIGVLIQLSGLGANTFIPIHHDDPVGGDGIRWLMVSFAWSFATSSLGILALFFIRQLLLLSLAEISVRSLVAFESFFAAGATCGLNFAWASTDIFLGLKPHILGAAIATLLSFAWCKLILYYCEKDIQRCGDELDRNSSRDEHQKLKDSGIVIV